MTELDTFASALDFMPDAVFVVDAKGRIVGLNAYAEQLTGYGRDEMIGRPVDMLVPAARAEGHGALRRDYMNGARRRPMGTGLDIQVRLKNGGELPADIALNPLQLDGRPYVLASLRDISDRRRIEQELRDSELRQRLLIDGVTDYAIVMLDPAGHVSSWNRGAERIKGYTGEEIIGRHFSIFYPPSPRLAESSSRKLQVAESAGRFEEEGWRLRKDGTRFWADVVITPVRDSSGKLRGFAKITRDISAQRRQQQQIEAALTVAQTMLAGKPAPQVLDIVARQARRLVDARLALVVEPDGTGGFLVTVADGAGAGKIRGFHLDGDEHSLSRQVIETRRALLVADMQQDRRANRRAAALSALRSAVALPLTIGTRVFGALIVGNGASGIPFSPADLEPLGFLATQASLALEHARIQEELQRLALVDERERIGRELHDGAIQAIFAIGMSMEGLAARTEDPALAARLRAVVAQLDAVIKDLRNYIYGLRPNLVREQQLEDALRQLVDDFASRSAVTAVADIDPEAAQALNARAGEVILLAGEALSNVGRHASALTTRLTLRGNGGAAILEVEDDGEGFDTSARRGHGQGLRNLEDRAAKLGGDATIESVPGEGTRVTFRLPV